jgi:hypothetical protein
VLRQIESQYPEIAFDWKAVVDNQQIVEPQPELRRPRKKRREPEGESAESTAAAPPPPQPRAESPAPASAPSRPSIPTTIQGATPDEQIAFLQTWYPQVRERIPQRTSDPARQQALFALAERLNPTNWTDADQITAGLQEAAEALERLSHVFARRRRRARRPPARTPRPTEPTPSDS